MTLPLSHFIPVTGVSVAGRDVSIIATVQEREAIAAENGLAAVDRLEARFHVTKGAGSLLAVQGSVYADVVQNCSVTLEPVSAQVVAEFALTFTLKPDRPGREIEVNPEDDDPPEPVIDGQIDFGVVAVEQLVLNLNPYPRADGAAFKPEDWSDGEAPEATPEGKNPFAALAALKSASNDP